MYIIYIYIYVHYIYYIYTYMCIYMCVYLYVRMYKLQPFILSYLNIIEKFKESFLIEGLLTYSLRFFGQIKFFSTEDEKLSRLIFARSWIFFNVERIEKKNEREKKNFSIITMPQIIYTYIYIYLFFSYFFFFPSFFFQDENTSQKQYHRYIKARNAFGQRIEQTVYVYVFPFYSRKQL